MSDLVVVDASVLLAIALPDPQANKDYASALLFAIDKGDVTPVSPGVRIDVAPIGNTTRGHI